MILEERVIRQHQGHCAAQSGGGTVIGRSHPDPAGKRTLAQRESTFMPIIAMHW